VSESSIGSGLRRIEAVTGRGAERYVSERLRLLHHAAALLEAPATDLVARAEELTERLRLQEKEIEGLRRQAARQTVEQLLAAAVQVDGVTVLAAEVSVDSVDLMRDMTDELRQRLGSAVVVLGAVIDDKPLLVAAVTPDLVDKGLHAGNLVGELARKLGGGGGGRPNMAQAGGRDAAGLPGALASTADAVRAALGRG